jgi:hypothetical protein
MHPYNLIVTNVPGPPASLYLLGARLLEGYPSVPLFEYQGLGVATFSYNGSLFWGLNADWDLVHDLHDFVGAIDTSFTELHAAATRTAETAALSARDHTAAITKGHAGTATSDPKGSGPPTPPAGLKARPPRAAAHRAARAASRHR